MNCYLFGGGPRPSCDVVNIDSNYTCRARLYQSLIFVYNIVVVVCLQGPACTVCTSARGRT